jgi:hypothetical protein
LLDEQFRDSLYHRRGQRCARLSKVQFSTVRDNCVSALTAQMYISYTINRALLSRAFNGYAIIVGVMLLGYCNMPLIQTCQRGWVNMDGNGIPFFTKCFYALHAGNGTL